MAFTIAVAGKGGVGKTTVAGLIVRELVERETSRCSLLTLTPIRTFIKSWD
jgi:CO dehydrogenase nickel-insertion accessory protein CooC1